MKAQWYKRVIKVTILVSVEVILNFVGFDDIADYAEFVFDHEVAIPSLEEVSYKVCLIGALREASISFAEKFIHV